MSKYKTWEEFLNKTYPQLYFSNQVQHTLKNEDTRNEAVKKYIERLEEIHNKAFTSKRTSDSNILKHFYYEKYIIKPENISENYFQFLDKQYNDQYGIHMTEEMKKEHIDSIIEDQKKSLDNWIDYLCSEDAKFYPTWAKYWAFQGMLTIGAYDNQNQIYKKRTKDTVGPFIELNQEVLAKCIDFIKNVVNNEPVKNDNFKDILTIENFSKMYQILLNKFKKINFNKTTIEGVWKKYDQGDNFYPLYESLQGYGTGWCTAGADTCEKQVKNGDFYVYYTYDKEGNPKIPRIAIRMDGKTRIGEIRGVAKGQNVESHLEEVLEEKLKEFPDRKNYEKRIRDSKKLTLIYEKYQKNIELEKEDLRFIYEIDEKISRFGYEDDPRKIEIKENRNPRKDYSEIFNVDETEIALSQAQYKENPTQYKVLIDNLDLEDLTSADGLVLPQYIDGYLDLNGLTSADGLVLPQSMSGWLNLGSLTSADGLVLPQHIDRGLYLNCLTSADGLVLPQYIGGYLALSSLTSVEGLILPQHIGENLDLRSLRSAEGLVLPQSVGSSLYLSSLRSAEGLVLPQSVGSSLYLSSLRSAKGLVLPQYIGGYLALNNLTSADGLILPDNFDLDNLICTDEVKQQLIKRKNINLMQSDHVTEENRFKR